MEDLQEKLQMDCQIRMVQAVKNWTTTGHAYKTNARPGVYLRSKREALVGTVCNVYIPVKLGKPLVTNVKGFTIMVVFVFHTFLKLFGETTVSYKILPDFFYELTSQVMPLCLITLMLVVW